MVNSTELSVVSCLIDPRGQRICLALLTFFLLSVVGTPVLAQDKPVIVQDEATASGGIKRPLTKVEKVAGDEKRDEKKDGKRVATANVKEWKAANPDKDAATQNPSTSSPPATPTPTPHVTKSKGAAANDLASQVNNPAAPVTLIQFRNIMLPNVPGTSGVTNSFEIQPIIPIAPSHALPFLQLIKITLPIASAPSPLSKTGLGDLQFFDLISIKQSWGRWGFGPALVFPTATSKVLGAGKWQAGPSFALIYTGKKNLVVGAVLQNPISFAGNRNRSAVNQLIVTPTLTFTIPGYLVPGYWKHGWFVGLSDYNWIFDWKNRGAGTITVGPQVGRVFHIGEQAYSAAIEAGGTIKRPANTRNPGLVIGIEFAVIVKSQRKCRLGPETSTSEG